MPYNYQHVTRYAFAIASAGEADIMYECKVKNILISYAYVNKFLKTPEGKISKHGTLDWLRDKFDCIIIDSGAHSAWTLGIEINVDDYSELLKREKENYTYAAQLDVIGDQDQTLENYKAHVNNGTDWVWPILTGNWALAYVQFEPHIVTPYFGVGGRFWDTTTHDELDVMRRLPNKYKFHGFARATEGAFRYGLFFSIDSSSWSFGARGGQVPARVYGINTILSIGRGISGNVNDVRYAYSILRDDCETCGVKEGDFFKDDYWTRLKASVPLFYRPLFREIDERLFAMNFYE